VRRGRTEVGTPPGSRLRACEPPKPRRVHGARPLKGWHALTRPTPRPRRRGSRPCALGHAACRQPGVRPCKRPVLEPTIPIHLPELSHDRHRPRRHSATSTLFTVSLILLIVGGINWALVGLFNFDLVAALFGELTTLSRIVYVLVGAAALYAVFMLPRPRAHRRCATAW